MKAVDTNVLARFFVNDSEDPESARQRPKAARAMAGKVFVPVTVLLEFEWVLRGFYQLTRAEVGRVLRALCGLENVSLEDRVSVLAACDLHAGGLDLADALHLARSQACDALQTFDRRLPSRAARAGASLKVELLR